MSKDKKLGTATPTSEKDAKKSDKGPQQGMVAPLQLTRWRFWAIFISLMISIFLFALGTYLLICTKLRSKLTG